MAGGRSKKSIKEQGFIKSAASYLLRFGKIHRKAIKYLLIDYKLFTFAAQF